MSENTLVPHAQKHSVLKSYYNKGLVVAFAAMPLFAMAEGEIDTSSVVTTIGMGAAAVGALGAAKIAPAALTWVWSLVTGMAKRG